MTFLNHFHQGGHPGAKARTCEVHQPSSLALTATLSHVVAQSMISHWVQRALNRGDSGGRSTETGVADRVGSLRTLPSQVVVPTGRNWAHMTWKCPQSPQEMGVVGIARIPKAWPPRFDFGEEGRPSHDFSYFSIPFLPWVFRRRLFKVLRKKMKSTVEVNHLRTAPFLDIWTPFYHHGNGNATAPACPRYLKGWVGLWLEFNSIPSVIFFDWVPRAISVLMVAVTCRRMATWAGIQYDSPSNQTPFFFYPTNVNWQLDQTKKTQRSPAGDRTVSSLLMWGPSAQWL